MKKIWNQLPMGIRYIICFGMGVMISLPLVFTSCDNVLKHYKPDNPLEEEAEAFIEHYTGVDVDLSPHSTEKR